MPNEFRNVHVDDPKEVKIQNDIKVAEDSIVTLASGAATDHARIDIIENYLTSKQTLSFTDPTDLKTDIGLTFSVETTLASGTTSFDPTGSEVISNWVLDPGNEALEITGVQYDSANVVIIDFEASIYLKTGSVITIYPGAGVMTNRIPSAPLKSTIVAGTHVLTDRNKITGGAVNPTLTLSVSDTSFTEKALDLPNWTYVKGDSGLDLTSVTMSDNNAVLHFTGTAAGSEVMKITAGALALRANTDSAELTITTDPTP